MDTANIIQKGTSLSEWFALINHQKEIELREEDNNKRERLKDLNKYVKIPYDVPTQFPAEDLAKRTSNLMQFINEHGDELCALRLIPKNPSLPKLRLRGLSVRNVMNWFDEQNIDPQQYNADFIPHSDSEEISTIFVINEKGIFGEVLFGKPIELTHGIFEKEFPILFQNNSNKWILSENREGVENHLNELINYLKVTDPNVRAQIEKELHVNFVGEYIRGYFETVKTKEFGTWFVDFNRLLADYLDPTIINSFDSQSKNLIKGICASKGEATGIVRIIDVEKIEEIQEFNQGEILVAKYTSPDLVQYMKKASAIVTDMGGVLSHAAIIARELQKPCIVGTKNATEILKPGNKTKVIADKGEIFLIG